MANGDTKTESYLRVAAEGTRADLPSDTCCNTKTQNLILGVANRIMDVEDEVEELKNNPDVVDIVDTYADLQAYDTQHLTDNDIIRVLQDETHSGNSTYYRFTKNPDTWTFIGEISGGSGPTVVQTTGTSTTDVMSQNATTDMIYTPKQTSTFNNWGAVYIGNKDNSNNVIADPSTSDVHETYFYALPSDNVVPKSRGVNILGSIADGQGNVSIGRGAYTNKNGGVALGFGARGTGTGSIGIGESADTDGKNNSIALGDRAKTTRNGEMNIGTGSYNSGYNNTKYRVLGGVHDPVDAHDAATKGYVDTLVGNIESALHAINNGGNA